MRIALASVAVLLAACSTGRVAPSATQHASLASTPGPTAQPTATPEPELSPDPPDVAPPEVTPDPDPIAAGEDFWEALSNFAPHGVTLETLEDATKTAHLVVRGRVTGGSSTVMESFGDDAPPDLEVRTTYLGIVEISEVLKGEPRTTTPGQVQVTGIGWPGMDAEDLPDGEVILFLMNYAQWRTDLGYPPADVHDDTFVYGRINGYQAALPIVEGVVDVIDGPRGWEAALGPFPSGLDGRPVEQVAARIRELAGTPAPTGTPGSLPPTDQAAGPSYTRWYWEQLTDWGPYSLTYSSLREATAEVDLIVRGRLRDFRPGVFEPFDPNAPVGPSESRFTVVEISQVLKGTPAMRVPGTVEVAGIAWDEVTVDLLPDHEVILFLVNHAVQREREGYPPASDPGDVYHYERPNGYQAAIMNIDGVAEIVQGSPATERDRGPFPWNVAGESIDELATRIAEIAGRDR